LLKRIFDDRLLKYTSDLVEALDYDGWGLADFLYDKKRNDYVFMELNAKFWASFEFALFNNSDFGKMLFGLDYTSKPDKYFTFVPRLITSNIIQIIRFLPQIIISRKTKSGSMRRMFAVFCNHWAGKMVRKT